MLLNYLKSDCKTINSFFSSTIDESFIMTCLSNRIQPYFFEKYTPFLNLLATNDLNKNEECARLLTPWTKGPFYFQEFTIDAEWDCSKKWDRVRPYLGDVRHSVVIDVGCGNGFYLFELEKLGAKFSLGIDPTFHYYSQYLFLKHMFNPNKLALIPLTLDECPEVFRADVVMCLGVLYHQTDPLSFLKKLRDYLKRKGTLVLETLIYPGEDSFAVVPDIYYAGMKNIYFLPTKSCLTIWLKSAGFTDISFSEESVTADEEQRVTEWSRSVSLSYFLDPLDETKTVEGYHRPIRIIAKAIRK